MCPTTDRSQRPFDLEPGRNTLEAEASKDGYRSAKQTVEVTARFRPAAEEPAAPIATEVAEYLDGELGFDYPVDGDAEQVTTAFDNADVQVRVYESERARRRAQRKVDEVLGDLQPTPVTCGVIEVSVAADETSDREAVERRYAQDIERALDREYDC